MWQKPLSHEWADLKTSLKHASRKEMLWTEIHRDSNCFPQPTFDKELQLLKEQVTFLGRDEIWRELLTSLGAGTPRCGTWILDLCHCTMQRYSGLEVSVGYRYVLSGGSFRTCLSETNWVTAKSFTEVHCKRAKLINCYEFFAFRAAKQRHILLKSVLFKNFLQWQIL